ncbi:glycogen-binding regulatory subunit of S/T protein phosphatase I [Vallitalea longa]|uniref:Glycogen-binding regulatory subunit of S/T protein phosphatase I n=1 Tax=Vallitalea longa TaxID=2936439 RepID=A0A9W6DFD0_9FIRM|nr:hypothetical protein [Vallitalea longa]GKX29357.1 glycogen-binding regulatory subunit of S/T protein phosphatase I [Vallitalea longa]
MLKDKKLNIATLLICFILTINILNITTYAQSDTENIQLYSSRLHMDYGNRGYINGYSSAGYIYIKNLDYDKKVTVHFKYNDTDWKDVPASYYKTLPNGYEIWKFETPYTNKVKYQYCGDNYCKFAIKYEVNGNTYWDNNNGRDYYLSQSKHSIELSKCKIGESQFYKNSRQLWFYIKDMGNNKNIKLRVTNDNWATYKDYDCNYVTSYPNGVEEWYINLWKNDIDTTPSPSSQYVLYYTVNGMTYWDNNFGENYSF